MPTRHLHRLPLRLRIAIGYALFLVAVVGGVGLFLLAALENYLHQEAEVSLRLRATQVEREITSGGPASLGRAAVAAALSDLAPLEEFSAPGIYVQVLDYTGAVLGSSPNLPGGWLPMTARLVDDALAGKETLVKAEAGSARVRMLARPVAQGDRVIGVVVVGESMHLLDVTLRRMQQLLGMAAASAALVSLLGGWWLTNRGFRPISDVTRVARRIAATAQFDQRIAVPPARDELGELVITFNDMLAHLEKTFARQREFLADASHELRGPMMVIRGNLDLLRLSVSEEERQECATEALEEVERMARLVSNLLFLSEVDAQEMLERRPVALHRAVLEAWNRAEGLDAGCHELLLPRNEPAMVEGDRDRLGQMIWNLVENALRCTSPGGRVVISLRNRGDVAELAVADTGVGISPEHLPRIFDRFYRVDQGRSRDQGGTGLGLAIVKQVVEAHGGQVRVQSEPGQGSIFTVVLPIRQTESVADPSVPRVESREGSFVLPG